MNQHFVHEKRIEITTLSNGLMVATERMPAIATATLGVWVGTGSRHERAHEHGLSHLIEHMAFKGTARRSARQIAEDIENVGGDINAATSVEYTSYTARVLGENVDVALDVLGDILIHSAFDANELAREKGVILQEYAAVEDTPDDLIYDAFMETAFSRQAVGRPILGTPETIKSFDEATIRAFLAREYTPGKMVLAAAGDVDHARIVDMAERLFGGMPSVAAQAPEPGRYTGGERRISRKLEQANLVLGLPGLSFKDPGYYAVHLFAHMLGGGLTSRLWHEVRETRGLAYSIDSFHWPFSDCGLFGIGAGTSGSDVRELMDVTLACMTQATRDISEIELVRAKAQMKVALLTALETPGGRIERVARQLLSWGRVVASEEIVRKVDALDVEHVREAGRQLLQGAPTLAAIGPIKGLPSLDDIASGLRG
ncbi:M16 family metallopeptidase [Microvirga lotononidis]|uniref:Putative Zn-dependent peptidase n=1 Tax=Microvirga lotononidis TaxID=864069 RepID=I4YPY8_9HYPH|nr:pitrilysin family protein [Microvirga lotononidis]EIM26030.1 putative Zn-dependent peptidase [Microvirga lotononidis]WQO25939.1 pitrilysin family protein [Microvirga lotononidis]